MASIEPGTPDGTLTPPEPTTAPPDDDKGRDAILRDMQAIRAERKELRSQVAEAATAMQAMQAQIEQLVRAGKAQSDEVGADVSRLQEIVAAQVEAERATTAALIGEATTKIARLESENFANSFENTAIKTGLQPKYYELVLERVDRSQPLGPQIDAFSERFPEMFTTTPDLKTGPARGISQTDVEGKPVVLDMHKQVHGMLGAQARSMVSLPGLSRAFAAVENKYKSRNNLADFIGFGGK